MDALDIHLQEFKSLRDEIVSRLQVTTNLVIAEVTLLGTGFSFAEKSPDVLVGAAFASSCLWVTWLELVEGIFKIAAYIDLILSPSLAGLDSSALRWERFLRLIGQHVTDRDYEGIPNVSHAALDIVQVRSTRWAIPYITFIFGITPVFVLAFYSYLVITSSSLQNNLVAYRIRIFISIFAICMHVYAWARFFSYTRFRKSVELAILTARAANTANVTS